MSQDGGDDTPPRPGRRSRRLLLASEESSEDSDDTSVARTRRKKLRVLSDDGSDSSGSSVLEAGARRGRLLPRLRDTDGASSSTGDGASSCEPSPSPSPLPTATNNGFTSDSSEGNSDKCSICLLRFKEQQVGIPQNCEHIFCLDCITEWSRNVNTCPVDRITFDSIVVKACIGGRVLRTEPVQVVERRSSVDLLIFENPTPCEICGSPENEATMLLCDGCDLGFHMECLTPPLDEIPQTQWFCPDCALNPEVHFIYLSEIDSMDGVSDMDFTRQPMNGQRSSSSTNTAENPSAASGGRNQNNLNSEVLPSTSRGSVSRRRKTTTTTRRRKPRRRRTHNVIVEFELEGNGKFPVTRKVAVKRQTKKRKSRVGRTVARRTLVRRRVRDRLAAQQPELRAAAVPGASEGVQELSVRRARAGIPQLSLFGSEHQLDYFPDEEDEGAAPGPASVAVARRPTADVLSAYRQARRKIVSIPSPPHTPSAPDVLSGILESQALLHDRRSVVTVTVDGRVNIKVQGGAVRAPRVDPRQAEGAARKAPSYPGQPRGNGGGWGGGYRGNYHREASQFNRNNNYDNTYRANQQNPPQGYQQNNANAWRDEPNAFTNYQRRAPQHQFPNDDELDRRRGNQPEQRDAHRGQRYGDAGRRSLNPAWQPYGPPRPDAPHNRLSFGGFDNALDMRVGLAPAPALTPALAPAAHPPYNNGAGGSESSANPLDASAKLPRSADVDKSEDERSDSGLVIDTEIYDPTEPTNDDEGEGGATVEDDGGGEAAPPAAASDSDNEDDAPPPPPPPPPSVSVIVPLPPPPSVQNLLAGFDTGALNVSANVLDCAVREAIHEHRSRAAPRAASDGDSDGDCPNFSIYSATSVHIANTCNADLPPPPPPADLENLQHLAQYEDEPEEPPDIEEEKSPQMDQTKPDPQLKIEDEYKHKLSKRCPITPNARNPIKLKLKSPLLIKRVSLYDDEDVPEEPDAELVEEASGRPETPQKDDKENEEVIDKEPSQEDKADEHVELGIEEKESDKEKDLIETAEEAMVTDVVNEIGEKHEEDEEEDEKTSESPAQRDEDRSEGALSDNEDADGSDSELELHSDTSRGEGGEVGAKMTESISETEDERSYTPCLDENKSKDTSWETQEPAGLEGLDTELISEEEGNDIFSDKSPPRQSPDSTPEASPPRAATPAPDQEDGEITEKTKPAEEGKKKKKKESKKENKDKSKGKKKGDVPFKKLSKSGKERNYRDKDEKKRKNRDSSGDRSEHERRKKEKRKDLERYDVRNVVTDRGRRVKDAFGRDISPRRSASGSRSPSPRSPRSPPARRSPTPRSPTPRARVFRSPTPARRSPSPRLRSLSPLRRSPPRKRRKSSPSPRRRPKRRRSPTPPRRPRSPRPTKKKKRSRSRGPAPEKEKKRRARRKSKSPRRKSPKQKKSKRPPSEPALELSPERAWHRWSVDSRLLSPRTPEPPAPPERARRVRDKRRRAEPERRHRRDVAGPSKEVFTSGDNILVSVSFNEQERAPDDDKRRKRKEGKRRERRRKRQEVGAGAAGPKPVAIIDLERSPFRELTPSPKAVIVLSDSDHGETPAPAPAAPPTPPAGPKTPPPAASPAPAAAPPPANPPRGPNTPPASPPSSPDAYDPFEPTRSASASPRPPTPPPDAAAVSAAALSPPRPSMSLETAQKTNMSADDVIDQRSITPIEKVMALLQSTRDVPPDAPPRADDDAALPAAPATAAAAASPPRAGVPGVTRARPLSPAAAPLKPQPKLFLTKPSPIKSNPIKPLQSTKISKLPLPPNVKAILPRKVRAALPPSGGVIDLSPGSGGASPYSPGSSDFGDLFEPPPNRNGKGDIFDVLLGPHHHKKKTRGKKKGGKVRQVGVRIDDDNLKILEELPNSAVEMQVKSKFLKKLNRQERVVEEVKLVLKPHYNKKRVSKDEYKDVLRRAVPKICHNKTGEINPTKIQALVEAYVKKIRKKHKLGLA